ncbi:MAG: histidinol-phosphate transaminase [Myxococcota bacterium]
MLFLDANEGPPPPRAWLDQVMAKAEVHRYPAYQGLQAAVAERHALPVEQVMVTAGGDEGIDRVVRSSSGLHMPRPTFGMFPIYCAAHGRPLSFVEWGDWEGLFERRPPGVDWLAVVAPNNPTGASLSLRELEDMQSRLPEDVHLLLDQVYAEFDDEPLTELALEHPRFVVVRSLSKSFGLAGLRVGYLLGQAELLARVGAHSSPYSIASFSAHVATQMLKAPPAEVGAYWALVRETRPRLESALTRLGHLVPSSRANFCFASEAGAPLFERLEAAQIRVRRFRGDAAHEAKGLRITCPSAPADVDRLLEALKP